ncbi:IBR domain-containing protein [Diplocarpon rosae]|nr:IBR domain-containing protein [Diplocarpon rosae]
MATREGRKVILPGMPPAHFQESSTGLNFYTQISRTRVHRDSSSSLGKNLNSVCGDIEIALFGPQYGFRSLQQESTAVTQAENENREDEVSGSLNARPERLAMDPVSSCIICIEDFSEDIQPPEWISLECLHKPAICAGCVMAYLESELDNKICDRISCPECIVILDYHDIKRLADQETFARYENFSLRRVVGADENFVWCQNCDSGQIHETGTTQPIVICQSCGYRSCFFHSTAWHDRLTCDEYDAKLLDPSGFQSAIDRDDQASALKIKRLEEEERLIREAQYREEQEETERQRLEQEDVRLQAEAEQVAAEAKKLADEERKRQNEELRRRHEDEVSSLETIRTTAKLCPGCQAPIEHATGCKHMTCIQCEHEFCYLCGVDWGDFGCCNGNAALFGLD